MIKRKYLILCVLFMWPNLLWAAQNKADAQQKIYEDPKWSYSVVVPEKWNIYPSESTSRVVRFAPTKTYSPRHTSIIITRLIDGILLPKKKSDVPTMVSQLIGPLLNTPGINELKLVKTDLVDGKKLEGFWFETQYLYKQSEDKTGYLMVSINYVLEKYGQPIYLSLTTPKKYASAHKELFMRVVNSLETKKSKVKKKKKK